MQYRNCTRKYTCVPIRTHLLTNYQPIGTLAAGAKPPNLGTFARKSLPHNMVADFWAPLQNDHFEHVSQNVVTAIYTNTMTFLRTIIKAAAG